MGFEADTEEEPLTAEQEEQLRRVIVDRAPLALNELADAATDDDVFCALPTAAFAAFQLGRFELAEELAKSNLRLAPRYCDTWNYGNALHAAHSVLGLLALERGDVATAVKELKRSGETPGSPQLGSFGSTMQLAKALLRRGETAPVLTYLAQCRAFWSMGTEWLTIWEEKIKSGAIPNFFMHSYR